MTGEPRPIGASSTECRALDRRAIQEFSIPGLLLMEHASIGAAQLACDRLRALRGDVVGARVGIICGPGNNGGDGYAVARHLHQAGASVTVWELVTHGRADADDDAARNAEMARVLGVTRVDAAATWPDASANVPLDLVVDAVFGTGLTREPVGRFLAAIRWLNEQSAPVLALDLPSGLDADSGEPLGVAVEADWTVTFGLVKRGLTTPGAQRFTGALFYVPIGIPRQLLPAGSTGFPPAPIAVRQSC
ncbi:MAG: NAD(P)H-hydrate epimerase [Planctomycetota bacterium]